MNVQTGLAYAMCLALCVAAAGFADSALPAQRAALAVAATPAGAKAPQVACRLRLAEPPDLAIARLAEQEPFYLVTGGVLEAQHFVLASTSTQQLFFVGYNGTHIRTIGGRGEGPGEFRTLRGLWRVDDSTLMVADPGRSRITLLSSIGEQGTSVQLQTGEHIREHIRWPSVVGLLGNTVVAINGQVFEAGQMGTGLVRPPYQFVRFEMTGHLRETMLVMPGAEFFVHRQLDPSATIARPFGVGVLFAANGEHLFTLMTNGGRLNATSANGTSTTLTSLPLTRGRVGGEHISLYKRTQREAATTASQRHRVELLDSVTFPDLFPTADRMLVDQSGDVWIRQFAFPHGQWATWYVVSKRDRSVCSIRLPGSLLVLDVRGDRVLGVNTDSLGVEEVRVYTLREPGA